MNKAFKIIENLRRKGFIVHYGIFSPAHLTDIIPSEFNQNRWKKDCLYTGEAIVRAEKARTLYNNKDVFGRCAFYATDKTLLKVMNNILKQIKEASK